MKSVLFIVILFLCLPFAGMAENTEPLLLEEEPVTVFYEDGNRNHESGSMGIWYRPGGPDLVSYLNLPEEPRYIRVFYGRHGGWLPILQRIRPEIFRPGSSRPWAVPRNPSDEAFSDQWELADLTEGGRFDARVEVTYKDKTVRNFYFYYMEVVEVWFYSDNCIEESGDVQIRVPLLSMEPVEGLRGSLSSHGITLTAQVLSHQYYDGYLVHTVSRPLYESVDGTWSNATLYLQDGRRVEKSHYFSPVEYLRACGNFGPG